MHDVLTKKKNCRLRDSVQGEPITPSMEDGSGIEGNTLDGKKGITQVKREQEFLEEAGHQPQHTRYLCYFRFIILHIYMFKQIIYIYMREETIFH